MGRGGAPETGRPEGRETGVGGKVHLDLSGLHPSSANCAAPGRSFNLSEPVSFSMT